MRLLANAWANSGFTQPACVRIYSALDHIAVVERFFAIMSLMRSLVIQRSAYE